MPLAYAFALNMASELGFRVFPGFSPRASSSLLRHDWPGNVRELKNAVERSVYRSGDKEKPISDIAFDPFDSPYRLRESRAEAPSGPAPPVEPTVLPTNLNSRVNDLELELLQAGLKKARFNQRVAANLLGLSYHQLRGKIRKHALDVRSQASETD